MFFNQNDRDHAGFKALRNLGKKAKITSVETEYYDEVGAVTSTYSEYEGVLNIHTLQAIESLYDLGYKANVVGFVRVSMHFYNRENKTEATVYCEFPGSKGSRRIKVYFKKHQFAKNELSDKHFDELEKNDLNLAQKFAVHQARIEFKAGKKPTMNSVLETIDPIVFGLLLTSKEEVLDKGTVKAVLRARACLQEDGQFELCDRLARFDFMDVATVVKM